jgi:hypothetical protein
MERSTHEKQRQHDRNTMVAARLANLERADTLNQGPRSANLPIGAISQAKAAEMLNVSERSLRAAKAVMASLDLAETVEHGLMCVVRRQAA